MTTRRIGILIGVMLCVGMSVVAVRSAVWMTAYELGRRQDALSRTDLRSTWLQAQVLSMRSPAMLVAQLSNDKQKLVAWSALMQTAEAMYGSHE